MRHIKWFIVLVVSPWSTVAQSLELMPGHGQLFVDIQWLKPLDPAFKWSVFSRTRATYDYDQQTDIFTGAYLNFTTSSGFGLSLVGKIAARAGVDSGLHFFRARKNWSLFALASMGWQRSVEYSWFSILRFSPPLNEKWKLYTSLELFTLFRDVQHIVSIQRLRLGADIKGTQMGLAANLRQAGPNLVFLSNLGLFIRQSF